MNIDGKNKVVMISGTSGYLGSSIAKLLSQEGYCIAALFNTSDEKIKNVIKNLSGSGHESYKVDLGEKDKILEVIEEIQKKQGELYACIHCAWARSERKSLDQISNKEISGEFNGNVLNSLNFLTSCANVLKKQKEGFIIGITTAGVVLPEAGKNLGTYILGKYALQGILNILKEELHPNVKVYSIAPGFMAGGMNSDIPKAFVEIIKQKSKDKRITDSNEVAKIVSKILSGQIKDKESTILIAPEYNN